jgi:hypothetical protein
VRLEENPSALLEWLHLEALGDCVSLRDSLVTLGSYRHLDGLEQRGLSSGGRCLSPAPIVCCEGFLTFPRWRAKRYSSGMRVACVILSCVGCVAPYWGFGVWCQLAREPPSVCIATTRTSLPANKWTSVKNHCVIFDSEVIALYWYSLLWLAQSSTRRYNLPSHPLLIVV